MNARKSICMVTATAVLMGSFAGCSLLGGKDKTAVTDAATGYIEQIMAGKYNKSAKFVTDEEDFFAAAEIDAETEGILSAVWSVSSFIVDEVNVDKNSATAEVTFELPDLGTIAEEGYSYDEYVDAIADIEEMNEETFEFEFSKDGEDWYIEADSTEDFYNFVFDTLGEFSYGGLSEAGAVEAVDQFISYLAQGDLQSAMDMSTAESGDITDYYVSLQSEYGIGIESSSVDDVFVAFFSNMQYETSIGNVTDDCITVNVTGTAPDSEAALDLAAGNEEILVPAYADYIESVLGGNMNYGVLFNGMLLGLADGFRNAPATDFSSSIDVTADEDGNLYVDPADDFVDWSFDNVEPDDELMYDAMNLLLEQGRISQSDYDLLIGSDIGDGSSDSDLDVTCIEVETGDDFYTYSYSVNSQAITLTVVTWDYYDQGTEFNYDVAVNGTEGVMDGTYVMPNDDEDHIEIQIPLIDPTGSYVVTVYDAGSTSSVLASYEFVILAEGAPLGDALLYGQSVSYADISDDFYTFHFLDGEGEWFDQTGSNYSGNRGAVDFVARTWDYYDQDQEMICEVYLNGELVETLTAAPDDTYTDTFYFTYEPSRGLEDGDYAFVMYDVDSDSDLFAIAYASVVSE